MTTYFVHFLELPRESVRNLILDAKQATTAHASGHGIRWIRSKYIIISTKTDSCFHQNCHSNTAHYSGVLMNAMASQITGVSIVSSAARSGVDKRKLQSSASLAFVRGIHRWPVDFPHKGPVTRKMFPFDNIIMIQWNWCFQDRLVLHAPRHHCVIHVRAADVMCECNVLYSIYLINITSLDSKRWLDDIVILVKRQGLHPNLTSPGCIEIIQRIDCLKIRLSSKWKLSQRTRDTIITSL